MKRSQSVNLFNPVRHGEESAVPIPTASKQPLACTLGWVTASPEDVHPDNVTGNAIRMRKSLLSSLAGLDPCLPSEQLLSSRDALL